MGSTPRLRPTKRNSLDAPKSKGLPTSGIHGHPLNASSSFGLSRKIAFGLRIACKKRGWTHSPSCPLCRSAPESALHLLAECRYTRRVWNLIAEWTAQPTMRTQEWQPSDSVAQWWQNSATTPLVPRKAMATMTMLVSWEIWKEWNRRVFRHHETSAPALISLIKQEALDWVAAGAKDLATLLSRE